jgi:hypothetical protein
MAIDNILDSFFKIKLLFYNEFDEIPIQKKQIRIMELMIDSEESYYSVDLLIVHR